MEDILANYGECDDYLSAEDELSGNNSPSGGDARECEPTTLASVEKTAETTKVSDPSTCSNYQMEANVTSSSLSAEACDDLDSNCLMKANVTSSLSTEVYDDPEAVIDSETSYEQITIKDVSEMETNMCSESISEITKEKDEVVKSNKEESGDSDSDCETSSSSTCESSDDSLDIEIRNRAVDLVEEINALKSNEPKVKGEILPSELPPVEDLSIVLPQDTVLQAVGKITQVMKDNSIVIQSHPNNPALDFETVLFLSHRKAIGKVEETFGPVPNPYYIVRFNSEEHMNSNGVKLGEEVFYAPKLQDLTSYVFLSALRQLRGSDASWCNDVEPPPSCVDYSDDEEEKIAKKARRAKKDQGSEVQDKVPTTSGVKRDSGGRAARPNRWHNESQRFNVMPYPNPEFDGWNAAVNRMSAQGHATPPRHQNPGPPFHPQHCMNRMPMPRPFDSHPPLHFYPGNDHFSRNVRPDATWQYYPRDMMNSRFCQPPPPPPPT